MDGIIPPVKSPYQFAIWWGKIRFCFPPKVLGLAFENRRWGPFQLRRLR